MKKHMIPILALVLLAFASCKEAKKDVPSASEEQMQLVMDIHDEVMPKMGKLNQLIGALNDKIKADSTRVEYAAAKKDLEEANTAMMDWMNRLMDRFDFDEINEGKALTPEKQAWLDEEEQKVREVRDKINSSIANAEALLGKE